MDYPLISPTNGQRVRLVTPGLLHDGERQWPVVDGIPFLRPKERLRAEVVAAMEAEDERAALRILLSDQDRFSPTAPPSPENVEAVIDGAKGEMTLRRAMELLNFGPVGDYFAYRWCSPTFTGGLHLLERTPPGQVVVEVACGIGHFLRALEQAGRWTVGIDIVYAKLWLAKQFLGVRGPLICGDIEQSPVLATDAPTTVFCHDAFYFFEFKEAALANMHQLSADGTVAVGHVHTRRDAHEAGFALDVAGYQSLTEAVVQNDEDAVRAWYGKNQQPTPPDDWKAVAWVEGAAPHQPIQWITDTQALQNSPLLRDGSIVWPSPGWQREYAEDAACLNGEALDSLARAQVEGGEIEDRYRQRRLVNLPARW